MDDIQKNIVAMAKQAYGYMFQPALWEAFPLETAIKAMQQSDEYDTEQYLRDNHDVDRAQSDPIEHFIRHGILEGRLMHKKQISCPEQPLTLEKNDTLIKDEPKKDNIIAEIISCMNCNSDEFESVYPQLNIVRCKDCGLVYCNLAREDAYFQEYYSNSYIENSIQRQYFVVVPENIISYLINNGNTKNFEDIAYRKYDQFFKDYMKPLLDEHCRCYSMLEIGCSWGPAGLAAKKYDIDFTGFEISTVNCSIGNRLGLNIYCNMFNKSIVKESSYGLVMFDHSLEHIINPHEYLDKAYNVLVDNGLLYITVSNFRSMLHFLEMDKWNWLDPRAHVCHYTGEVLCQMVKNMALV